MRPLGAFKGDFPDGVVEYWRAGKANRKTEKIITKAPQLNTLRCHFVDSTGLAKGLKHLPARSRFGEGRRKKMKLFHVFQFSCFRTHFF
jgi:hypothetical protein